MFEALEQIEEDNIDINFENMCNRGIDYLQNDGYISPALFFFKGGEKIPYSFDFIENKEAAAMFKSGNFFLHTAALCRKEKAVKILLILEFNPEQNMTLETRTTEGKNVKFLVSECPFQDAVLILEVTRRISRQCYMFFTRDHEPGTTKVLNHLCERVYTMDILDIDRRIAEIQEALSDMVSNS